MIEVQRVCVEMTQINIKKKLRLGNRHKKT